MKKLSARQFQSFNDYLVEFRTRSTNAMLTPIQKCVALMEQLHFANPSVASVLSMSPRWRLINRPHSNVTAEAYANFEDEVSAQMLDAAWFNKLPSSNSSALQSTFEASGMVHMSQSDMNRQTPRPTLSPSLYQELKAQARTSGFNIDDQRRVMERKRQREEGRCFQCNELLKDGCGGYRKCKNRDRTQQKAPLRAQIQHLMFANPSVEEQIVLAMGDYEQEADSQLYALEWSESESEEEEDSPQFDEA